MPEQRELKEQPTATNWPLLCVSQTISLVKNDYCIYLCKADRFILNSLHYTRHTNSSINFSNVCNRVENMLVYSDSQVYLYKTTFNKTLSSRSNSRKVCGKILDS